MPRKLMDKKDWADLSRHIHNQGIGELQTKGLTEEEESREMKKTFQEISELGYGHIHTLKVVPSDGREPYFVRRDDIT
jgi:hypothetical protein